MPRKMTKQEREKKKKEIISFIKRNVKRGHYPGFLEIKKKLKISPHHYFNTIADIYKSAGIKYDHFYYYRKRMKRRKNKIRSAIISFLRSEVSRGNYPTWNNIEKKFSIAFLKYFGSIREAYRKAGIEYIPPSGGKTEKEKRKVKKAIIDYIKGEVAKGRKPDVITIIKNFKISPETYFPNGYHQLFKEAKLPVPDAFLNFEKERCLTVVAKTFFKRLGYKIIRTSIEENRRGPDLLIRKDGKLIPVELKANATNYMWVVHKEKIFSQILRYVNKFHSPYGIILTTSGKIDLNGTNKRIILYAYDDLSRVFKKNKKMLAKLRWINMIRVLILNPMRMKTIQKKVIQYVKQESKKKHYPTRREIQKKFRINLDCYFKNVKDVYNKAKVRYPSYRINGLEISEKEKNRTRERICKFIKKRWKEGKPITHRIIQSKFHISYFTYFKNCKEMYKAAGIRLSKTESRRRFHISKEEINKIRLQVVEFVGARIKEGKMPTKNDIVHKFHINIKPYFHSYREVLKVAEKRSS